MTKKQELLQGIEIIKNEHIRWATYAEAKFNGLEVDVELTPVKHTDCACGKMIAENGQIMYHLKSANRLAKDHEEFHKLGKKLYDFMNNKKEGNFLTKHFIDKKNNELMSKYASTLKKLSENIINSFNNIKNEITNIPDKTINSLFNV
jgi:hypothetical protein